MASRLVLPDVPDDLRGTAVAVWREPVEIDTYETLPPSRYPAYLDRRVYQGSSGAVYPLPFHERIASTKHPHTWDAWHVENAYVRLMVLPELGGRIHVGYDKTSDYDFFYRNNVIKPALVGLAGPWLSGGVELNWPQHHRPATHLPVQTALEHEPDGAVTLWCADLDPFARMKGMHGIRLRPDSSLVELRVRLTNRSAEPQTFLWWANVAAHANEHYQSFFPTDVHVVADHAKRAVVSFPRADRPYYGIDYPARVDAEHPDADRLDWYRNIPVPTSYMCLGSQDDFFGGYDHARGAGFVHWADHRIAPGKKQWTWGNAPFGWAWDANLTDGDGPYVELMAGVFTDNQPDFSWLMPGETKTFSQFWYPIQGTGPVHQATPDAAVSLSVADGQVAFAVTTTRLRDVQIELTCDDEVLLTQTTHVGPGDPFRETVPAAGSDPTRYRLIVRADDRELIAWQPRPDHGTDLPAPADEPPAPSELSPDELYTTGLHLAQYRHATRSPEDYWREALRRDPHDQRCATALAWRRYDDGRLSDARELLEAALARQLRRNPNPADGEPHYLLGLVLLAMDDPAVAYDAFAKAAWNAAWRVPSWTAMARLDLAGGRPEQALVLTRDVLDLDRWHGQARALQALALRRLDRDDESRALLDETLTHDPLDWWALHLCDAAFGLDPGAHIDLALEYASAGETETALRILDDGRRLAPLPSQGDQRPLMLAHRADLLVRSGHPHEADAALDELAHATRAWCFPGRLADAVALERLLRVRRGDPALSALLGHWLYAHGRPHEAVGRWRAAPDDPVCLRNIGVAAFNALDDPDLAVASFNRALGIAGDAQVLYERDQLAARLGECSADRLRRIEPRRALVDERDDLTIGYAQLLMDVGRPAEAHHLLSGRHFQPWEGGEGQALGAWERSSALLARQALADGDPARALRLVDGALEPPTTLGEQRHELANRADLDLLRGDVLAALGRPSEAAEAWGRAAAAQGDFLDMASAAFSPKTLSSVTALRRLGRLDEARSLAEAARDWATARLQEPGRIDYFATSLPTLLLFHEDAAARHVADMEGLRAMAEGALEGA